MAGATKFERTQSITSVAPQEDREKLLNKIANELEMNENDEEQIRIKEQGILELGQLYKQQGKAKELADLIAKSRPFLNLISKAKAAKLVRSLVDFFLDLEAGTGIEVQLCKDCIEWAKQEKRTFLRQSLEARLIALYFDTGLFAEALALGSQLLKELKKMDDKNLLVEVQLLESKTYHALSNLSKVSRKFSFVFERDSSEFSLWPGSRCLDLCSHHRKLHLLPTESPSLARLAVWHPPRSRRARFQDCLLLLLRSLRGIRQRRERQGSHSSQVHVAVQDHAGTVGRRQSDRQRKIGEFVDLGVRGTPTQSRSSHSILDPLT
jgi:hypothetical protein